MNDNTQTNHRVTQMDVARLAGVSQAIVSYVVNDAPNAQSILEETRQRVEDAVVELGYVPNVMARRLRLSKTYTIACVIPDITNPFYPEFQHGVQMAVQANGYDLVTYSTDGTVTGERKCVDSMLQGRVDGVVGVFFTVGARDLKPLLDQKISIVRLESGPKNPSLPLDSVYIDNREASGVATQHLIDKGHTSIGMLSSDEGPASFRQIGYEDELQKCNLGRPLTSTGAYSVSGGYEAMRVLLRNEPQITAILAANDLMALGAMMFIREAGLVVPDDIAVVGFDDIAVARLVHPSLTSVAQSQGQIGTRCAEMLLDRLDGRYEGEARNIEMPFDLIERESTAFTPPAEAKQTAASHNKTSENQTSKKPKGRAT